MSERARERERALARAYVYVCIYAYIHTYIYSPRVISPPPISAADLQIYLYVHLCIYGSRLISPLRRGAPPFLHRQAITFNCHHLSEPVLGGLGLPRFDLIANSNRLAFLAEAHRGSGRTRGSAWYRACVVSSAMGAEPFRERKCCRAFYGNFFDGFILLPLRGEKWGEKKKTFSLRVLEALKSAGSSHAPLIHIYINVYMHACMQTYIYMNIHTHIHLVCLRVNMHLYACK